MAISQMHDPVATENEDPLNQSKRVHQEPSHEEIARLAYVYWSQRRPEDGTAEDDWLRAEATLRETGSNVENGR
jgi:hypothetical protein